MKKIVTLQVRNFFHTSVESLIPFIITILFFASCNKEDPAMPAQLPIGFGGVQNALGNETVTPLPPLPGIPSNATIFISHGPCLGNCPVYTVTLTTDGIVTYNGQGNVGTFGQYSYKMSADKIAQLQSELMMNGFFELQNSYPYAVDAPQTVTAVRVGYDLKVVVDYGVNAPPSLTSMRQIVNNPWNKSSC